MKKLEFGHECKDIITGTKGYLVDRTMHITGCDNLAIATGDDKKKWFAPTTVRYLSDGIYKELREFGKINEFDDLSEALFEFGNLVKDSVTGQEGKVIAKSISISGDINYAITPEYKRDSKNNDSDWYDEGRLTLIKKEENSVKKNSKRVGGVAKPQGMRDLR